MKRLLILALLAIVLLVAGAQLIFLPLVMGKKKAAVAADTTGKSLAHFAHNYYVAPWGNDSNSGHRTDSAWQHLSKVNATPLSPGDSIFIRYGPTWREGLQIPSSGSAGNNIVFTSYGGGRATISGSDVMLGTWTNTSGNIWRAVNADAVLPMSLFFNDTAGTYQTSKGALASDKDWFAPRYDSVYIYSTRNPNTRTIENSFRDYCVLDSAKSYITIDGFNVIKARNSLALPPDYRQGANILVHQYANYVTVKNCSGSGFVNAGVRFLNHCTHGTVQNCSFHNPAYYTSAWYESDGIHLGGSNDWTTICKNMVIRQDTIYNVRQGIQAYQDSTVLIDSCLIYNCDISGIAAGQVDSLTICNSILHDLCTVSTGCGIDIVNARGGPDSAYTTHTLIQGNTIYNVFSPTGYDGNAILLDISTRNAKVLKNTIHDVAGQGIYTYFCDSSVIAYNDLRNVGTVRSSGNFSFYSSGIDVGWHSKVIRVVNNTIYSPGWYGLSIEGSSGADSVAYVTLENNIVVAADSGALHVNDTYLKGIQKFSHNDYYPGSTNLVRWNNGYYSTMAAYQAGQSQDPNSINSNPTFVTNYTNLNLQAGSPAINAGHGEGSTTDHDGSAIIGIPDMGAYESSTAAGTYYRITVTAGAHGSIIPPDSDLVMSGNSTIFFINPQNGYAIQQDSVDHSAVGTATRHTFSTVTAAHSFAASFVYRKAVSR